jgi:phage N-6-adenine-methyltransferase
MTIAPPCHTRTEQSSDSWITPKWLINALGPFDLDPCASISQPWPCAQEQYTEKDNGLLREWKGFVWLNPPYGRELGKWLNRLALHRNGIALVFARTETRDFFINVWPFANAMLFIRGRLTFHYPDGSTSRNGGNSGGPSVLIAYGDEGARRLKANKRLGALIHLGGSDS